jgi:hypothetical protein
MQKINAIEHAFRMQKRQWRQVVRCPTWSVGSGDGGKASCEGMDMLAQLFIAAQQWVLPHCGAYALSAP